MSNNNKNISTKSVQETVDKEEKKRLDATRIFLIVFAAVAAVGIITALIFALIPNGKKTVDIDYLKDDLSQYVSVPGELYTDYKVNIELSAVSDRDVEYEVLKLLSTNRISIDGCLVNRPGGVTISAGDVANIYYRGYTLNEDGTKNYFDGGCNFPDSPTALQIGSGKFIPGFEYNLVGKCGDEYAKLTKKTEGKMEAGDIISLTYSVHYADGNTSLAKTALIDLSDPDLDEKWGEGFSLYFNHHLGRPIGEKFATGSNDKLIVGTTTDAEGDDIYFDMIINGAYTVSEEEILVVEAYFPFDYGEESLNGKTAYFEVFIKSVQDYGTPEFNDAFITDTLKMSAEDLASYKGETLTEKYKSYIRSDLEEAYDTNVKALIEAELWKKVVAGSTFKKLPESEVQKAYNSYVTEIENTYANGYTGYYNSLDAFARAYLSLDSTADWKAKLRSDAEYSIKQKLAFYAIIRELNFVPNDEEYQVIYNELFDEYLQSYLDYYGYTEDTENYEAKVEAGKKEILSMYSDSYWRESVIYEYAIDKLIDRADVVYPEGK